MLRFLFNRWTFLVSAILVVGVGIGAGALGEQASSQGRVDVIDGKKVGAIDAEAMAKWSEDAFALFLTLGLKPDGEFVGGKMEPVIAHNTGRLSSEDRAAMVAFFVHGQE